MIDLAYTAGSVLFFALMLAYVHACDRLGHTVPAEPDHAQAPQS